MATWFPASQLLLVALLGWNVLCYPAKTGWSQRDPNVGAFTNVAASPGLVYSSFQSAPAQPSSVSYPAAPFPYQPSNEGVYPSPEAYPGSSSPTPGISSTTSWASDPLWDAEGFSSSGTSQPMPGALPPPPFYQAGELANYEGSVEDGNSERETEELNFPSSPPSYPGPGFQAGEYSHYAAVSEHGNEERETEDQGFGPFPPYASASEGALELPAAPTSDEGPEQPDSQSLGAFRPDDYYLFLTGQLPPGTVSRFDSDYENGRDHWNEVHYERYYYPSVQQEPSLQQVQDYTKL